MASGRRAAPPDGGYGWVVVASAFFVMGLTTAVLKNFGIFFMDIQSHFGVLNSTTSWVTSTAIAMFHLGGPAASSLTHLFSQRVVIIAGGLLAAAGMALASLDLGLPWLYFTLGFLQGTGISLSWIPATSIVSHYFERWRPIAFAVASSGECVFAVIFSPLFHWLIEAYGWQGALLVVGGLQLNVCVCGALMRPLEDARDAATAPPETKACLEPPKKEKKRSTFQCSLLRTPELALYILFSVVSGASFFVPSLFLVPFAVSAGMDEYWPASVLSVLAVADLAGRLTCGWVSNMALLRNLQLLALVVTMVGVVLLLLPVSHNYWAILCLAALYGFLFGCMVAVHVTVLVDIVGLDGFDSALGMMMMFRSIGGFVGPPAAGWLVDETKGYSSAFYFSGLCLIMSAVFVVLVDRLVLRRKGGEVDERRTIGLEETLAIEMVKREV